MFWEKLVFLCNKFGTNPNAVCAKLKLSNATATHWKNGSVPRDTTLKKIADYFGVSTDYLLDRTDVREMDNKKTAPHIEEQTLYNFEKTEPLMLRQEPNPPFPLGEHSDNIVLTANEIKLILAYRNKPEMQESVNILLGTNTKTEK